MIKSITRFFAQTLWRIPVRTLTPGKAFFIKTLRVVVASVQHFFSNRNQLTASALTYYTLLSIVPVLATMLAIAKGFGLQTIVEEELILRFSEQEAVFSQVLTFAHTLLDQVKPGLLAFISVAFLLWAVIKVLSYVERAFNMIWRVERARHLGRRFTDYLAVILLTPILFTGASALTVFVSSSSNPIAQVMAINALPYVLTWLLFTLFYIFMPNTRVRTSSAVFGGVVAGTVYQILQLAYVKFQIGVSDFGAIYGSFAALPLFLIWLQLSWVILLLGAELAYASQHVSAWELKKDAALVSIAYKRLLYLFICRHCLLLQKKDALPVTTEELSEQTGIPIILTETMVHDLCRVRCLVETSTEKALSPTYTLSPNTLTMTIKEIIDAIEHAGIEDIPLNTTESYRQLRETLEAFEEIVAHSPLNKPLSDP